MTVEPEDQREPGRDLALLYANWARAVPGPSEVAVDLGYSPQDGIPQPAVRVILTWENAKVLKLIFDRLIEQREENAGEIKLPPEVSITEQKEGPS